MFLLRGLKSAAQGVVQSAWHLVRPSSAPAIKVQAGVVLSPPSAAPPTSAFLRAQAQLEPQARLVELSPTLWQVILEGESEGAIGRWEVQLEPDLFVQLIEFLQNPCYIQSGMISVLDLILHKFYIAYRLLEKELGVLSEECRAKMLAELKKIALQLSLIQQLSVTPERVQESDAMGLGSDFHLSYRELCRALHQAEQALCRLPLKLAGEGVRGSKRQAARQQHLLDGVGRRLAEALRPIQFYNKLACLEGSFRFFAWLDISKVVKIRKADGLGFWCQEKELFDFVLDLRASAGMCLVKMYRTSAARGAELMRKAMKSSSHRDCMLALRYTLEDMSWITQSLQYVDKTIRPFQEQLQSQELSVQQVLSELSVPVPFEGVMREQLIDKLRFLEEEVRYYASVGYSRIITACRLICRIDQGGGFRLDGCENLRISCELQLVLDSYRKGEFNSSKPLEPSSGSFKLERIRQTLEEIEKRSDTQGQLERSLENLSAILQELSTIALSQASQNLRDFTALIYVNRLSLALREVEQMTHRLDGPYGSLLQQVQSFAVSSEADMPSLQSLRAALEKGIGRHHRLMQVAEEMLEQCLQRLIYISRAKVDEPKMDLYDQALHCLQLAIERRKSLEAGSPKLPQAPTALQALEPKPAPGAAVELTLPRPIGPSTLPSALVATSALAPDLQTPSGNQKMEEEATVALNELEAQAQIEALRQSAYFRQWRADGEAAKASSAPSEDFIEPKEGETKEAFEEGVVSFNRPRREDCARLQKLLRKPRKMLRYLAEHGYVSAEGHKRAVGSHRFLVRSQGQDVDRTSFSTHPGAEVGMRARSRLLRHILQASED